MHFQPPINPGDYDVDIDDGVCCNECIDFEQITYSKYSKQTFKLSKEFTYSTEGCYNCDYETKVYISVAGSTIDIIEYPPQLTLYSYQEYIYFDILVSDIDTGILNVTISTGAESSICSNNNINIIYETIPEDIENQDYISCCTYMPKDFVEWSSGWDTRQ